MLDPTQETTNRRQDAAETHRRAGAIPDGSNHNDVSAIAEMLGNPTSEDMPDDVRKPRHGRRLKWLVVLGAIVSLGAIAPTALRWLGHGANADPAGSLATYAAQRSDLLITITEDGSMASAENVDIKCEVAGGTTIVWIIDDGKKVTKGTELLRLDGSKLKEDVSAQKIAYEKALAASIQSAKDFAATKIAVEEYTEGTFKKDFRKAESDVVVAQEALRSAENTLQHGERMFRKGYITPMQYEGQKSAVARAKLDLGTAEIGRDVLQKFTRPKMVQELQSKRDAAEAKRDSDKASLALEEAKLKRLTEQLGKCTVRAPKDGLVIYANERMYYGDSDGEVKAGMKVYEESTILRLPNLDKMQADVGVHEAKVDQVRVGLRARIRVQDRDYQGSVASVANRPQSNWMSSAKKYSVKVRLDGEPKALRPGMTAEVEILVAELKDVISLPVAAVAEKAGQAFCCVKKGPALERRNVVLGMSNDRHIEIKEGIAVGEVVVLNPRAALGDKGDESQKQPDAAVKGKFGSTKRDRPSDAKDDGGKR